MAAQFETSHEYCREKVCVVCYKKGSRKLSVGDVEVVREFIIEAYSVSDSDFPNAICTGCSLSLSKKRKNPSFVIPNQHDDYDPGRRHVLRSSTTTTCDCKICTVAKQSGISLHHSRKDRPKRGRPAAKQQPEAFKICSKCFTKLYRGCSHSSAQCSSRRNKIDSIIDLSSPTSIARAASRIDVSPMPLGRPKGIEQVRKELFTVDDIYRMGQNLNLSSRGIKTLAQDIRIATGSRKAIEKNVMQDVQQKNHRLDEYFEVQKFVYRHKDKETKLERNFERETIMCNNITEFVEAVLRMRDREWGDSLLLRVGIDGGGGFFKVCLSVFDKDDPFPHIESNLSRKFKESGVKKVFILALVPGIQENYVNVKRIWVNLCLHRLQKYTIAADLKLCNILLGMMSHSSCHPCCWCDATKDNLGRKGNSRTIKNLMELFWDYFESGSTKEGAKKYGNVIHPPMINDDEDDETLVITLLPPPELHLMTGPMNTMYSGLESLWPESENWLKSCNIEKTDYHGGCFTGPDTKKLLKNIDRIEAMTPNSAVHRYVNTLNAFNDVVSACYGDDLQLDYANKIKVFSGEYRKLGINITPKIHAVMFHIEEFCTLTGRGLAPWSEQTSESIHHDFKPTWDNFKVKSVDNPKYSEHLLRAVQTYNGKHI